MKKQELQDLLLTHIQDGNCNNKSLREITRLVGEKYPQRVKHHLEQMAKHGLIMFNIERQMYMGVQHSHEFRCVYCNASIQGDAQNGAAILNKKLCV